jgi:hypothetical protein
MIYDLFQKQVSTYYRGEIYAYRLKDILNVHDTILHIRCP